MRIYSFRGGIQPNMKKNNTKEKEIQRISAGKRMVFPLSRDGKNYAFPVVCIGDFIQRGQKIAEENNGADTIYSSVSGEVTGIETCLNEYGVLVKCIVIENDECDNEVLFQQGYATQYKKKLNLNIEEVQYIIIDTLENEPYLTCEFRRMKEYSEVILLGIRELLMMYPNARCFVCISSDEIQDLTDFIKELKSEDRITVKIIKNKYPKQLETVLPRKVDFCSCLFLDLHEVCTLYYERVFGIPRMERLITISGDGVMNPGNYFVQNGTTYRDIFEKIGGIFEETERIISGGVLAGKTISSLNIPFTLDTNAITCLMKDSNEECKIHNCIKCGRCVEVCPKHLNPIKLAMFAEKGETALFEKWNGTNCIACGCCSYKCPAKINLKDWILSFKQNNLCSNTMGGTEDEI